MVLLGPKNVANHFQTIIIMNKPIAYQIYSFQPRPVLGIYLYERRKLGNQY